MKLRAYNPTLIVLIALMAVSMRAGAKQTPPTPPVPPVPSVNTVTPPEPPTPVDPTGPAEATVTSREFKYKAEKFRTMSKAQMKKFSKTMTKTFKNFDKSFTYIATDFGDTMASTFKNIDRDITITNYSSDGDNEQDLDEKSRTYSKSYPADNDDLLDISNKYGKVTVNTWAKNEFKVDVLIKVGTSKEGAAQKMLDNVKIVDGKDGSRVYFRTEIGSDNGSWSSGNNVRKMEINYTIYMPARNPLKVTNKYGSTELPDLAGKVIVDNSYGSLSARRLSNPSNSVAVKYGSARIEGYTGGDLNVAYGSLSLEEGTRLNAVVSYGSAKIGSLKVSGNINAKYSGTVNIGELDADLKNLSVNASYSGVKVGVSNLNNTDYDVTVHYGSFNFSNNTNEVYQTPSEDKGWSSTKTFKGRVGKGGSGDKTITITSNYGSVKFE